MSLSRFAGIDELTSSGVGVVLTTRLSKSSFGENLRAGSIRQLRICIASSKWSGHVSGKSVHVILFHPSSLTSGAQRCDNTYSNILLVPSTRR